MTTTLQAIGVTLAGGSITLGVALLVFGQVLRNDNYSVFMAPRCVARPRQVIFNALPSLQQQQRQEQQQQSKQQQQCGGPTTTRSRSSSSWSCCMVNSCCCSCSSLLSWIPWVLSLDYHTLLDGVPGTGTRQHGMAGSLLKCQLDAIVMLRFHAIGLKISTLVTVLCVFVVLPVYWNSECYFQYDSLAGCQQHGTSTTTATTTPNSNSNSTSSTRYHHYLTNYGRTTIANVPSLVAAATTSTSQAAVNENEYSHEDQDHDPQTIILVKLYAICFIFCIISAYWVHLIQDEWIQILAMRRVYYLEHDVWGERKRELQSITAAAAACTTTDATEQQAQQQQQELHTKQEHSQDPPNNKSASAAYYSSSSFFTVPRLTSSSRASFHEQQQVQTLDSLSMSKSQILPPLRPRSSSSGLMKKIDETVQPQKQQQGNVYKSNTNNNTSSRSNNSSNSSEPHLIHRDPWVPHPEQRDTVPNISLYSVLVGGLPSLPEEAIEYHRRSAAAASAVAAAAAAGQQQAEHEQQQQEEDDDEGDALYVYCKKRASIDWQLALTSAFFDHCVPNQPGFSSSVAAVTILPSSRHIAIAWRKWYAAAAQLRRLRFIRQQIAKLRDFEIQVDDDDDGDDDEEEESKCPISNTIHNTDATSSGGLGLNLRVPAGDDDDYDHDNKSNDIEPTATTATRIKPRLDSDDYYFSSICSSTSQLAPYHRDSMDNNHTGNGDSINKSDTARNGQLRHENSTRYYHQEVLGCVYDQDLESQFYQDLQFGPEQTAVYSREFAQAASPCCPNGCWSDQIAHLSIDDLIDMERDAVAAVHQANMELLQARRQATRTEYKESSVHSKYSAGAGAGAGLVTCAGRLNGAASIANVDQQQKQQPANGSFVGKRNTLLSNMPSNMSLEASIYNKAVTASMTSAAKATLSSPVSQSKCPTSPSLSRGGSHVGSPVTNHHIKHGSFDMANVPSSLVLEADLFSRAQHHSHGRHVRKSSWDSSNASSAGPGSVQSNSMKSKKTPMVNTSPQRHEQPKSSPASRHRKTKSHEDSQFQLTPTEPPSLPIRHQPSHLDRVISPSPLASIRKRELESLRPMSSWPAVAATAVAAPREGEKNSLSGKDPGLIGLLLLDDIAEYNKVNNNHAAPSSSSIAHFHHSDVASSSVPRSNFEKNEQSSLPPLPPRPTTTATPPALIGDKNSLTSTAFEPGVFGRFLADDISEYNKTNSKTPSPLLQRQEEPLELSASSNLMASKSSVVDENSSNNYDTTSKFNLMELNRNRRDELPPQPSELLHNTSHREEPSSLFIRDDTSLPSVQTRTDATHADITSSERKARHPSTNWELVQSIVADVSKAERSSTTVSDGSWRFPTIGKVFAHSKEKTKLATNKIKVKTKDRLTELTRESTYAVVTFTSRQAAVAARHCLADGRGADRWMSLQELPISPLADAAACDLLACRNCCRPVTMSIDERQKMWRNYFALLLLAVIYIFYTIPLTLASTLVAPENLEAIMPEFFQWVNEWWNDFAAVVSGLMQSLIWTAFFASCPVIFKAIANFGSKATSVANAEFTALQYFWWFMLTAAFTGPLLANSFLAVFRSDITFESSIRDIMRTIGQEIPTTIAASWLNWIILRFTFLLPLNYLLNVNTFIFHWLGMNCCSRMVRGGGPGGPVPYRVYVDSCMVILCLLALAPASPLIAPACLLYFLLCQPLFRWNAIFVYRPKYDGGGLRWPFLSDMMFSALFMAQILLTTQMALKAAVGPAVVAAFPLLPTLIIYRGINKRFRRAFTDAALLQTSLLDGWDTNEESTLEKREEFRRFLVDAHKAAYVPICIAGNDDGDATLTAEPAVVLPAESDMVNDYFDEQDEDEQDRYDDLECEFGKGDSDSSHRSRQAIVPTERSMLPERRTLLQRGATMRRAARTITAMQQTAAARQRRNTAGSRSMVEEVLSSLEGIPTESAFDKSLPVLPSPASLRHMFQYQQERNEKLE